MINQKKLISYLLFIILLFTLTGCNIKNDDKNVPSSTTTEKVDYKKIYKQEVDTLISKYGKFEKKDNVTPIKGLKYGELLDFNKDGIPELIIVHDGKVLLYTIKDGKASNIYEGLLGSRYGQTDVSTTLAINSKSTNPSIILNDSKNSWSEENIFIITLENGDISTKNLIAKASPNNTTPTRENLIEFFVDNKSTTKEDYEKIYNSLVKTAKTIDVFWDIESATAKDFDNFLLSLE